MAASSMGDGRFDEDEHILHQPVPAPSPADLWTLVDTTGDGRADAVVLAADGVRIFRQDENGDFAPAGGELVLTAFGHDDVARGWQAHEHERFLADTTTDGRLDMLGCHDVGVWVALQNRERAFAEPVHVLGDFGADQDRSSVEEHTPGTSCTPPWTERWTSSASVHRALLSARGRSDGTFEPALLVRGVSGEYPPRAHPSRRPAATEEDPADTRGHVDPRW
ncbi:MULTISPECIES: FG-GAP-like repeat-containing protein [Streptomyces]|uniref:FG-GAP-like repeat-containing protein n=1 Tax=Streptomyces TaxID=1883 RepID=UPI0027B9B814|nr:FG-GAP-like repeat-containing protein [Streptomyces sp. or20]